jgi:sugar phosphate isomerase/epimerase
MRILFFCPLWGSTEMAFEAFLEKVKKAGYDGVEMSLPLEDEAEKARLLQGLDDYGLLLVAQHYETEHPDPETHLAEYIRRLENLASARPLLLNTQTGKDWFSFEDNLRLIRAAAEVAERSGVKILHETHRGKFSFCAATTRRFLEAESELRISADFSHWCVVSESLLADQAQAVDIAIERADHIHARVGHAEAAQVSDPRAPEWLQMLETHLGWWDRIVERHRRQGTEVLTITPEFGPAPYMPLLPYTGMPVASQWEINTAMMEMLRKRYA